MNENIKLINEIWSNTNNNNNEIDNIITDGFCNETNLSQCKIDQDYENIKEEADLSQHLPQPKHSYIIINDKNSVPAPVPSPSDYEQNMNRLKKMQDTVIRKKPIQKKANWVKKVKSKYSKYSKYSIHRDF